MPKVLAVNNYPTPERFVRLTKCLEEGGADVSSVTWNESSASKFNAFDGVALSGAPEMLSKSATQVKFRHQVDAIRDSSVPILGVCFGHQMIAHAFGSKVTKDAGHVLRFVRTEVIADDPLFRGLPSSMMLLESRHEVVDSLPSGFKLLARSETSKVAAMKHTGRPLYGVQFHPERFTSENPDGKSVVANFLRLLG